MMDEATRRLEGTRIADGEGRPLILHHGTYQTFDRFGEPSDIGHHFGALHQARAREREKSRDGSGPWIIRRAAIAARNVLVYPDDPKHWNTWYTIHEISTLAGSEFTARMRMSGISDPKAAAKLLRLDLLDRGIEAIAYRNVVEGKGGATADWSFIALDPTGIVDLGVHGDPLPDLGPIGLTGLDLPPDVRSVPGGRSATGSIRYGEQRARLIEVARSFVIESGGTFAAGRGGAEFTLPCGALLIAGSVQAEMGRVRLKIDRALAEALSGEFDDFCTYDMTGHGHVHRTQMTYSWVAGETAETFMRRFASAVDRIETRLSAEQAIAPAA